MLTTPIIGVTTQTLQAIDGIPAGLPQSDVMNQRYYTAVAQAGGAPVLIPLLEDELEALEAVYEACDGILLPGGVDMDPIHFNEKPHDKLGRTDSARASIIVSQRWFSSSVSGPCPSTSTLSREGSWLSRRTRSTRTAPISGASARPCLLMAKLDCVSMRHSAMLCGAPPP